MNLSTIDPLIATGVVLATAATDAVYVMFTSAVVARHRVSAATWSSIWYLLSSFAVIHYTENWIYVAGAAPPIAERAAMLEWRLSSYPLPRSRRVKRRARMQQ